MKNCKNCGTKIEQNTTICPNCNINLYSDSLKENKLFTIENIYKKIILPAIILVFVSGVSTILMSLIFVILRVSSINNAFIIFNNIINVLLYVGIILFVLSVILYFVKYKNKFIKTIINISIVILVVGLTSKNRFKIDDIAVLKDYTKSDYIEIGTEKIPSLYSVVGEKNILTALKENANYDSDIGIEMDSTIITYNDIITTEEINKYKNKLLNYGFKLEKITNGNYTGELYIKNNYKDNTFYIVSIDGSSIIYSISGGNYEDILEEILIK